MIQLQESEIAEKSAKINGEKEQKLTEIGELKASEEKASGA